jgi:hypothetical protein
LGDQEREAETGLEDFKGKSLLYPPRGVAARPGGRGEVQAIDNPYPTFLPIRHTWSSRMFNNTIAFAIYDQFIIDIKAKSHRMP